MHRNLYSTHKISFYAIHIIVNQEVETAPNGV